MRRLTILTDPRRFLRDVIKTIRAIEVKANSRVMNLRSLPRTPGVIKQATVGFLTDPRRFLRDVIKTIRAIEAENQQPGNDPGSAGTPGVIKYAAVFYPTDPRRFLR